MLSLLPKKLIFNIHSIIRGSATPASACTPVPPELLEEIMLISVSAYGRPWHSLELSPDKVRRYLLSYTLVCKRWAVVAFPLLYQSWKVSSDDCLHHIVPPVQYGHLVRSLTVGDPSKLPLCVNGAIFTLAVKCLTTCPLVQELSLNVLLWHDEHHIDRVIQALAHAKQLRKFTFRTGSNRSGMVNLDYKHLARIAEVAPQLEAISVVNLTQRDEVAEEPVFPSMPRLTTLALHDADLDGRALNAILRSTTKLEHLHVTFIFYGSRSTTGFADALSRVSNTLVSLNMQRVGGKQGDATRLQALLPTFKKLRSFTCLQMQGKDPLVFRGPTSRDQGVFAQFPSTLRQFRISTVLHGMQDGMLGAALAALPKSQEKWYISFAMPKDEMRNERLVRIPPAVGILQKECGDVGFRADATHMKEFILIQLYEK
ncbi:hypothetical protein CALCODRAFT_501973 [Calocera cornea HHB12733]|uniref:F-box domain-containing protein n=1 Tax=Calocera cornea HHB12733 TaxID=1353952 RepID=A0A165DFM5_9BASI|nr:hypothetical protein CALCODRAFT_501973 [Calocera cornea HHB12733]